METRVKCIKDISPFEVDKEYDSDSRIFTNNSDSNDKKVLLIESTNDGVDNCYLLPLEIVFEHFIIIN